MPKKKKLIRCNSFAVGFDEDSDVCAECEERGECMALKSFAEMQQQAGVMPHIPVFSPSNPPVIVTRPTIDNGKVSITLKFDKKWLRKILGWTIEDEDKDRKDH